MPSAAECKWMIKSENRILGPYSFEQIEDLLRKRQVSLIDEVRDMDNRWTYIRENEDLKDIVEIVREELAKKDDHTKTYQTRTSHNTKTNTKTGTITEELPIVESKTFEMPTFTNVAVEDVEFTEAPVSKPKEKTRAPNGTPQYVAPTDPLVKAQINNNSRTTVLIFVSILVGFIVAASAFYFYQVHSKRKHEQHIFATIRKYSLYGLDSKVVEIFGSLNPELQKQIIPDIIPVIPRLDSAGYINGSQTIASLKAAPHINNQRKALLNVVEFIQAVQDQNLKIANESLGRAKDLDPTNESLKENEGILKYLEGKYDEAAQIFSELFREKSKGRLLLGWAISQASRPNYDPISDAAVGTAIDRYTQTHIDFKKELLLVNMLFDKRNNKEQSFNMDYQSFISVPLNLRQYFLIPLSVYNGIYSMNSVKSVFDKLNSFLSPVQKFVIETHLKLETGELSAAQTLYSTYNTTLENVDDRINLRLLVDYALKDYSAVIAQEKTITAVKLNTAGHYSLFMAKKKLNAKQDETNIHLTFLRAEKNILSLWAQLNTITDFNKKISFVQVNSSVGEDFIPFLEVKGSIE